MNLPQCYTIPAFEIAALQQNMKAVFCRLTPNFAVFGFWPVFAGSLVSAKKINQSRLAIVLFRQRSCKGLFTPYPRTQNLKRQLPARGRPPRPWLLRTLHLVSQALSKPNNPTLTLNQFYHARERIFFRRNCLSIQRKNY